MIDYYAILGLAPGATPSQVKAQFRLLAMAVHPDRNADDPQCHERLRRINAAYELLSDTVRKAEYDALYFSHTVSGKVSLPLHASPSCPVTDISARTLHLLTLIALCVLLVGVLAAMAFDASSQSTSSASSSPRVTIIELPSAAEGANPASGDSPFGAVSVSAEPPPAAGVSSPSNLPMAGTPAAPDQGPRLWPSNPPSLSGSLDMSPALNGPFPVSVAAPSGPDLSLDADFPSH